MKMHTVYFKTAPGVFILFLDNDLCYEWNGKCWIMYVLEWRTVSALTIGLLVSAETVLLECTYIISLLTRQKESINNDKTPIFAHRSRVSLTRFSLGWWRHNRLLMTSQWPDSCHANYRLWSHASVIQKEKIEICFESRVIPRHPMSP